MNEYDTILDRNSSASKISIGEHYFPKVIKMLSSKSFATLLDPAFARVSKADPRHELYGKISIIMD